MNRGFIVETNFTPCKCRDKPKHMVFDDDLVDLYYFQWMTEHEDKVVSFFNKQGRCPTCKEDLKFDMHWVVTHQEEEKESLNHMFGDVSRDLDKLTIIKKE